MLLEDLKRFEKEARDLKGWNLKYQPKQLVAGPPWNYESRARELAASSKAMLDIGTGGGEVFKRVIAGLDIQAFATEAYWLNAPVAAQNLCGLARVVRCDGEVLPFRDDMFDLVLSRHTAIEPSEIARVLAREGYFLTQQVIPDHLHELKEFFPDMTCFPDHFTAYRQGLEQAGLTITLAQEFRSPVVFSELGHLVYLLVATVWTVPDFSVDTHRHQLEYLYNEWRAGRKLEFTGGCYVIEARHG